jgi:hypothetical protein
MKPEYVSAIGGIGAITGIYAKEKLNLQTKNKWIDTAIGLGIAVAGYFMDMDGFGDFVEGFGIGYLADALL